MFHRGDDLEVAPGDLLMVFALAGDSTTTNAFGIFEPTLAPFETLKKRPAPRGGHLSLQFQLQEPGEQVGGTEAGQCLQVLDGVVLASLA